MQIIAKTEIDFAAYKKFSLFHFMQGTRSPWQARIMIALPVVMTILFLVLFLLDPSDSFNLVALFIMLAMSLMLPTIIMVMPRQYYKKFHRLIMLPTHFRFSEDQLEIETEGPKTSGITNVRYERLYRVFETADFFYIYLSQRQAHIVGKRDFTTGSAEDLHIFLLNKIGRRFQVVRPGFLNRA